MRKYIAAVAQINTATPWAENMQRIEGYIDDAAARGAKLIAFPESFSQYLGGKTPTEELEDSPTLRRMAAKARQHGMWVLCGSLFTPSGVDERRSNTSVLLDPRGEIAASYEKMHMFDVTLPDGSKRLESNRFRPGERIVTLDSELGVLGMSVCFDVRFPELYRIMALQGAQGLLVPSMFTK
ncbi:MAG: carbon-nitrogen hydrolase family protein, partial [Oscillospiraceae bacterium]|nr:carbon-nitrogen hydrolase family protein [Oscillospiraceae bacterium]